MNPITSALKQMDEAFPEKTQAVAEQLKPREETLKENIKKALDSFSGEEKAILANGLGKMDFLFKGDSVREGGLFDGCSSAADYALRTISLASITKVNIPESKGVWESLVDIGKTTGELVQEVGKSAKEFAEDHPVVTTVVAGVATGGAAFAAAGPIAATLGAAGCLGTASTGTVIGTLSGAALESASLAAVGGGALAAGGGGMAAGAATIGATGAAAGSTVGFTTSKI